MHILMRNSQFDGSLAVSTHPIEQECFLHALYDDIFSWVEINDQTPPNLKHIYFETFFPVEFGVPAAIFSNLQGLSLLLFQVTNVPQDTISSSWLYSNASSR